MAILIVAPLTDEHGQQVRAELEKRGERVFTLDLAELPQWASVNVSVETLQPLSAKFSRDREPFDLDEIETIWMRRFNAPIPSPLVGDPGFAVSECHQLLVGLAQTLRARRWVNPLSALALDAGWGKIRQLDAARWVGLEIPRTLATNDPERAREFLGTCSAGAIYKPFAAYEKRLRDGQLHSIWTTEITEELLARQLPWVAFAPCIFQERVPKRVELRVTVMGARAFACEIHSQTDPAALVDYRRRYLAVPHATHELPAEVKGKLIRLHRDLGLVFGTADLILTPDGRYVFLETNQQGQWLWSGVKTGYPLVASFCDLLQGKRIATPTLAG